MLRDGKVNIGWGIAAIAMWIPSCTPKRDVPSSTSSTVAQPAQVIQAIYEARGRYLISIENRLKTLHTESNRLRGERNKTPINDSRYQMLNSSIQRIDSMLEDARKQLKALKEAEDEVWQAKKPPLDTTLAALEQEFNAARASQNP